MSKVNTPKGTRDFNPLVFVQRKYIFDTIAKAFQLSGFLPIETPSMENLSVLNGKYGEEGDRLIFKILNSGEYLKKVDSKALIEKDLKQVTSKISEKGLRYDLTVPFARYVVQHLNTITLPFKRYQIQPVWRAERPQKGRYREFFQCDGDIIGTTSLLNEMELLKIFDSVYSSLGLTDIIIKLNNRKILTGLSEIIGEQSRLTDMTVVIDKLDKIGIEKVQDELKSKGFDDEGLSTIKAFLEIKGDNKAKLAQLSQLLENSPIGLKGIEELSTLLNFTATVKVQRLEIDPTLARGLNYYTGAIFEAKPLDDSIGSIGAGGRYDNLTEVFGLKDMSGVGLSFGADRIYDLMEMRNLFPKHLSRTCDVLVINFDDQLLTGALDIVEKVKANGHSCMLYPEPAKMKKQMKYANSLEIPLVILYGEDEAAHSKFVLKNMQQGTQETFLIKELKSALKKTIINI
ncbi:MAG: histidine--tRNA ligase [Bacteriovoracaceae bacterium]|jgi:histidyl-tRNA synthetase|nr:histidine--tRNA ligase [Bacteriovoracaceae bacterium]